MNYGWRVTEVFVGGTVSIGNGGSVRGLVRDIPCSTEDEMGTKACRVFLADDDG
jgi:hypothetical protein